MGVTGHDRPVSPHKRSHRVSWRDLGGLVEDSQVPGSAAWIHPVRAPRVTISCPPMASRVAIPRRSRSGRRRSPAGGRQRAPMARAGRRHGTAGGDHASTATSARSPWCSAAVQWETVSTPGRPLGRQGGLHSTIVRCRGATSHSTRIWSRTCAGTRCSHQRRTRATSSSGNPVPATRRVLQNADAPADQALFLIRPVPENRRALG